jgi:hypothetical protein
MALTDFSGLLFGSGGSGLEGFLTPEQQSNIQNQAMLQAASALLAAGGPRREPISVGQALGGALQAGQVGYQQAQQGAIQNLLVGQKLQEGAIDVARNQAYLNALAREGVIPATAGVGGIPPIPAGAGGVPPAGSAPVATTPTGGMFSALTPEQRRLLPLMKPTEAIQLAAKAAGEKATQLSESDLTSLGLPPTTLAYKLPTGETKIIYRPDYQWIETPAGGKQLMDMNNPLGVVPKPVQDRVVASGTVPKPTGAMPTYGGGMAPALKPEQIMTTVQDWDTKYRTPVENILQSYNIVKDLAMTGQGGISDYGILIKALKGLDPSSAVMQGEAQSAQQMQALADRVQGYLDKIQAGGVGSEQARLDLANLARSSAKVAIDAYNRQADRKSGLLRQYVPQSVIDATFQKYAIPPDIVSKESMQQQLKAGTVAPAAGQPMWRFKNNQWVYE